jgi:dolichol kinase
MMNELPYALLIVGAVMVGLYVSNVLYDLKVPQYISRKIGHFSGGLGFLLCALLFNSGWWLFGITAAFFIMLFGARFVKPDAFRGVGGTGRAKQAFAEVYFPLAALPVIGIGWVWLNKPIIAVACLLFMAWGDGVTGIIRSQVYGKAVKGIWGSAAMLVASLIIAWAFIHPFWIGAVGAVVATVTEWACGDVGILKWSDDNWAIPIVSFGVVFSLLAVTGGL